MNSRRFNVQFRPLVDRAWRAQCELTGTAPNNRAAKDRWYREQLMSCCGIRSTRQAGDLDQRRLIDWFTPLAETDREVLHVEGWSPSQVTWCAKLAEAAWAQIHKPEHGLTYDQWLNDLLESADVHDRSATDNTRSFDDAMAALAVAANDERAISHFSEAAEIRMRWQIRRYLGDLEWLQKRQVDTSYVAAIWGKAKLQPADIDDAPADTLRLVLAMIDTHIRRLCKDYNIRPMDLPSRGHPHRQPVQIRETATHLHVGHNLEHCPPVRVTSDEPLPF